MIGTPVGKRVLLEMNEIPNESSSGILLASAENVYFDNWKVTAIGPDVKDVKVGDIVYADFNIKKPASWIMAKNEKHLANKKVLFVEEDQIIAVLEN
jgi:co-chaperonin GroES (HSP10)